MTTNTALLNEVSERLNNGNENICLFPFKFKESRQLYSRIDEIEERIRNLKRLEALVLAEANEKLEEEYLKNEERRIAHEFLSKADGLRQTGDGVLEDLHYGNSKAIKDADGRWFRTMKDACEYHGVEYQTFQSRLHSGKTIAECFAPARKYKKRIAVKVKEAK